MTRDPAVLLGLAKARLALLDVAAHLDPDNPTDRLERQDLETRVLRLAATVAGDNPQAYRRDTDEGVSPTEDNEDHDA